MSWPHLRVASSYSMRYGTSSPTELATRAAADGHQIMALTDRDGISGAIQWVRACQQANIAPIAGVDLRVQAVAADQHTGPNRHGSARQRALRASQAPRVTFLARGSAAGWASLCHLISAAHAQPGATTTNGPAVSLNDVQAHGTGLVALLGPDSELGMHLHHGRLRAATHTLHAWRHVMADSVAVAIANHDRPPTHPWSALHAAKMWQWARDQGARVVYAHGARYLDPQQGATADVLDAARTGTTVKHLPMAANGHATLDTPARLETRVQEIAQLAGIAPALMRRDTWLLAQACTLDGSQDLGLGSVFVPEYGALTGSGKSDATGAAHAQLATRCHDALAARYRTTSKQGAARTRLADELATIAQLGLAGYFWTVAEVVDLVKQRGIRVAARGSGAGSLVNYLLGISGVDPLEHGLLFERFLSTRRDELPDIDIDVESARRLEVYDLIYDRFGPSRVACVSMMDTYKVRQAIRDVGAAMGANPADIDSFAKALPHTRARNIRSALAELPELRNSDFAQMAAAGKLEGFLDQVQALDGLPRHMAMHPCGVLLSDATLLDRTPVQPSAAGYPVSQYDKHDVEHMGLLKLDVLGVRMQSAIAHTINEIQRSGGPHLNLETMPLNDDKTFELIRSTRTLGCFQIESPGQRELIGKFAPQTFNDLIIDISLFRPGPVKSDMITPLLKARHGVDQPLFLHPDLVPFLDQTEGVVVFHEQVMQIIATVSGCDLAQADQLRKAMSHSQGILAAQQWLMAKAREHGYAADVMEQIWDVLASFASFGFCKAHAAAFALPTYQSAWLKAHYPAAFYAGILTHDPGMYPKRLLAADARIWGVPILGVDINKSRDSFHVEPSQHGEGVRVPFTQVTGISDAEVTGLLAGQPYRSLTDTWQRSGISRPTAHNLALVGAFDQLYGINITRPYRHASGPSRRDLLSHITRLDRHPGQTISGQLCLDTDGDLSDVQPGSFKELTPSESVRYELELLGMEVNQHLLEFYEPLLSQLGITKAKDLASCRSGQEVLVAGVKAATQTPPIRDGKRVVFLTLDDQSGPCDATFFPDAQQSYAGTVFNSWILIVRGQVRRTGPRAVSIRATGAWELGSLFRQWRECGIDPLRQLLRHDRAGAQKLGPADLTSAGPGAKLWHSSPGSSGR